MNGWAAMSSIVYHGLRIATRARIAHVDEGGLPALHGREPLIIAANHQSHADTPAIAMAVPPERRPYLRFVASAPRFARARPGAPVRERVERWFLHGMAVGAYRALLVGDELVGLGAVGAMVEALEQGSTIVIFPEGTRSVTGRLGAVRPGAAIAALEARVPVVPVRVDGTGNALPKSSRSVGWRPNVTVRFRAPIRAVAGEDPLALAERIRAAIGMEGAAG